MRAALAAWPIDSSPAPGTGHPDVTFLIGHRGRARLPLLLATLGSIAAQDQAAVECIVVEQAASAEVERDLPSWVRYIHQQVPDGVPYNRAATFNTAAAAARGAILVLHDNDMLVPVRYAAELIRQCGRGWDALDLKRFIFYLTESDSTRALRGEPFSISDGAEVIQNLRGGSIAITRAAYEAIGGFDETFVGWGGEDLEFWERAETLCTNRFGYLPIVHLWHEAQPEKKRGNDAPGVKRYNELAAVPVAERIARLLRRRGDALP
jgi:GT2 family glycosyltransferase